jgi:hypothetical protein
MNKETIVTSAFRDHRSKFSCSIAAALLTAILSILRALLRLSKTCGTVKFWRAHIVFRSLLEGYLLFRVVGTADERAGFDAGEAQGPPLLF